MLLMLSIFVVVLFLIVKWAIDYIKKEQEEDRKHQNKVNEILSESKKFKEIVSEIKNKTDVCFVLDRQYKISEGCVRSVFGIDHDKMIIYASSGTDGINQFMCKDYASFEILQHDSMGGFDWTMLLRFNDDMSSMYAIELAKKSVECGGFQYQEALRFARNIKSELESLQNARDTD